MNLHGFFRNMKHEALKKDFFPVIRREKTS